MASETLWQIKRTLFGLLVRTSNAIFGKDLTNRSPMAKEMVLTWRRFAALISPAHRRQARYEREHPDAPWLVPEAIERIEAFLKPQHVGFEWGCGRSTLWFARRMARITSVEGRREWYETVSKQIADANLQDKVTLLLAEVTREYDFDPAEVERYAAAVDVLPDASLDFALVDGHFRMECLQRIGRKLRFGALLVIDNTDVIPEAGAIIKGQGTHETLNNGISETMLIRWQGLAQD